MFYRRLQINHNHGCLVLADVAIIDGEAVGLVVSGHSTSRLFHASSTRHEVPGVLKSYPLWGRRIREKHADGVANGKWVCSPTPGEFVVDVTFCG